jgi:hypothetical protein
MNRNLQGHKVDDCPIGYEDCYPSCRFWRDDRCQHEEIIKEHKGRLLSEEEIIALVTDYHLSGVQNRHVLARNVVAKCNAAHQEKMKRLIETLHYQLLGCHSTDKQFNLGIGEAMRLLKSLKEEAGL